MNITLLGWAVAFVVCCWLAFSQRSSWGFVAYLMTYFALPSTWWWGESLAFLGARWNLVAAVIFLASVCFDRRPRQPLGPFARQAFYWLVPLAINAVAVHFILADTPELSWECLTNLLKREILTVLIILSIRDEVDLRIIALAVVAGTGYLGYEVVFNDEGNYFEGRLEHLPIPNAREANELSCLLLMSLPCAAVLLLKGKKLEKLLAAGMMVLVAEMLMRCNSRGAMVGLACGAVVMLVRAPGRVRLLALAVLCTLAAGTAYIMGPEQRERIRERIESIMVDDDEMDAAAESRLDYWRAGGAMLRDHPLGSGGNAAFRSERGLRYIRNLKTADKYRSVHNGYLDVAAGWGVQGLVLLAVPFAILSVGLWRLKRTAFAQARHRDTLLVVCLESSLATALTASMFTNSLDAEWTFWWLAIATALTQLDLPDKSASHDD